MKKSHYLLVVVVFGACALIPLGLSLADSSAMTVLFAAINAIGWLGAFTLLEGRQILYRRMQDAAQEMHVPVNGGRNQDIFDTFFVEVTRRVSCLKLNSVEDPLTSKADLSAVLRGIVNKTHQLLGAASTELAIFERDSGTVHASFVVGMPFRTDAPTVWRRVEEGQPDKEDPNTLIRPLKFSGRLLGTLRVALPPSRVVTPADRDMLQVLAVNGAVAMLNAEYGEQLKRMRRSGDESVKAKTGFLANLSHEIRGPLGLILNAVELVLDELCGPITPEQKETLSMVKKNGSHLLDLINDVLDYAKSESGRIKVEVAQQPVNEFLTEMLNVVRAQAEAKKHQISLGLLEKDLHFSCDRRHSRQMMINLLTNAIKYTPPGGKVEIRAERLPGNKVRFSVRDSGVGIGAKDHDKVFTAFERVDDEYSSKQSGTGLGMPLTRKLAELNNGTVEFESEQGKGSHFWITLPIADGATAVVVRPERKEVVSEGKGETLLIIEANEGERGVIERYLKNHGFAVRSVPNQEEAQRVLAQQEVDLAILDNETIDQPQQELMEMIRGSLAHRKIPLILVSSKAFVFDIEEYLKRGIDRCLTKPYTMKELGKTCRELIDDNRRITRQSQAMNRPTSGMFRQN